MEGYGFLLIVLIVVIVVEEPPGALNLGIGESLFIIVAVVGTSTDEAVTLPRCTAHAAADDADSDADFLILVLILLLLILLLLILLIWYILYHSIRTSK